MTLIDNLLARFGYTKAGRWSAPVWVRASADLQSLVIPDHAALEHQLLR